MYQPYAGFSALGYPALDYPGGLPQDGYYPYLHVAGPTKQNGQVLSATWSVINDSTTTSGFARIRLFIGSGLTQQSVVGPRVLIAAMQQVPLLTSLTLVNQPAANNVTVSVFLDELDSASNFIRDIAGHTFLITVTAPPTGPVLSAVGDPVLS